MRGVLRLVLQRRHDDIFDPVQQDRWRAARPRFVGQAIEPVLDEPAPPPGDRARCDPQVRGHLLVRHALRAGQHDLGPQRQRLRRLGPPRPAHQLIALRAGQRQPGLRPPRPVMIREPVQPGLREPRAPFAHRVGGQPQLYGDTGITGGRLRARQHDPGPFRQPRRPALRHAGKLETVVISQHQRGSRTRHNNSILT